MLLGCIKTKGERGRKNNKEEFLFFYQFVFFNTIKEVKSFFFSFI
jgi:hypothetical protein